MARGCRGIVHEEGPGALGDDGEDSTRRERSSPTWSVDGRVRPVEIANTVLSGDWREEFVKGYDEQGRKQRY